MRFDVAPPISDIVVEKRSYTVPHAYTPRTTIIKYDDYIVIIIIIILHLPVDIRGVFGGRSEECEGGKWHRVTLGSGVAFFLTCTMRACQNEDGRLYSGGDDDDGLSHYRKPLKGLIDHFTHTHARV